MTNHIKSKIRVEYSGGESRRSNKAVDYMLAVVPGDEEDIELYAEVEAVDDGTTTYKELKNLIIEEAKEKGVDIQSLSFLYDGQEGF